MVGNNRQQLWLSVPMLAWGTELAKYITIDLCHRLSIVCVALYKLLMLPLICRHHKLLQSGRFYLYRYLLKHRNKEKQKITFKSSFLWFSF